MEEIKKITPVDPNLPTTISKLKSRKKLRLILIIIGLVLLFLVLIILNWQLISKKYNGWFKPVVTIVNHQISKITPGVLKDDWVYKEVDNSGDSKGLGSFISKSLSLNNFGLSMDSAMAPTASTANLGFAVGGAKDVNNFRKNIEENYLPLPSDITYEGLFYDYYFDTGQKSECQKLFCPSYATAVSSDPISKQTEYYLSVGLNSGLKETDFKRKKLNLVIVLDISGSMGSPFDKYYYDRFGRQQTAEKNDVEANKSKLELAAKSVVALLDQLNPEDRVGIVLFDDEAYLAKPLNLVGETDLAAVKNHILEITERGGTQMSAGIKTGTELYSEYLNQDKSEYENRMIFLTDAMPNLGETSEEGLLELTKKNATNGIFTTFIGVGVDFNTELVDAVTKISGANYYSVHSSEEFRKKLTDEFEFMVTPLVFDLKLALNSSDFVIEKVYGSPEADEATGEIMKVNTLFPSTTENGQTRGGLILLKLKKIGNGNNLILKTSYLDRQGVPGADEVSVNFNNEPHYFNTGIRKGITLVRYTNLIKNWIIDIRKEKATPHPDIMPLDFYAVNEITGLSRPYPSEITLGQWERQSMPLTSNANYAKMFKLFSDYYNSETSDLADKDMDQEKPILDKLIKLPIDNKIDENQPVINN